MHRWIKEPFCGLSHAVGVALAVAGLIVLLVLADGRLWHVVGFTVYGSTLVLLYLASTLCHSLHCSPRHERQLDRFDHIAIFLLIAGTYTPLCLVPLRGPWGWTLLAIEWGVAIVGGAAVALGRPRRESIRVLMYVGASWLVLIAVGPLTAALSPTTIALLLAGGVIYTAGGVIYALDRPHLWPGRFNAHDLWHVFVLGGSACHFFAIVGLAAYA